MNLKKDENQNKIIKPSTTFAEYCYFRSLLWDHVKAILNITHRNLHNFHITRL